MAQLGLDIFLWVAAIIIWTELLLNDINAMMCHRYGSHWVSGILLAQPLNQSVQFSEGLRCWFVGVGEG